jgi:8-oxo-dGTP diphosphatase
MTDIAKRAELFRKNDDQEWKRAIRTPRVGVAAVVESADGDRIVLISRKFPPYGLAFPGGFMDIGETFAETGRREVKEEVGLNVEPFGLLNVTSGTDLDPRMHLAVIAGVFRVPRSKTSEELTPGDDATKAEWQAWEAVDGILQFLTPRSRIIMADYRAWRKKGYGAPLAPLR